MSTSTNAVDAQTEDRDALGKPSCSVIPDGAEAAVGPEMDLARPGGTDRMSRHAASFADHPPTSAAGLLLCEATHRPAGFVGVNEPLTIIDKPKGEKPAFLTNR